MTDLEKAIDLMQNGLVKGYNGTVNLSNGTIMTFQCGIVINPSKNFVPTKNDHNNKVNVDVNAIKQLIQNYDTNPTGDFPMEDKIMTVYHGITIEIK